MKLKRQASRLAFYKLAHLVNTSFILFSPNLLFWALHFFKAFATMEKGGLFFTPKGAESPFHPRFALHQPHETLLFEKFGMTSKADKLYYSLLFIYPNQQKITLNVALHIALIFSF